MGQTGGRRSSSDQEQLEVFLGQFERAFPFGDAVRKFFRAAEADPIFAGRVPDGVDAPKGSWYLLVRLPPNMEERFGITREFLVYCTSVGDLQVRAVSQIQELFRRVQRPIDRGVACVVTEDERAEEKLRDWAIDRSEGLTLVPLTRAQLEEAAHNESLPLMLPELLGRWLYARNLYDERTPVTGDRFFGRGTALGLLERVATDGRHVGVFGLRKIGKTSLLLEVQRRLRKRSGLLPVFVDLQGSSAAGEAAHVAYRLGQQTINELARAARLTPGDARRELGLRSRWDERDSARVISDVCDGMSRVLTQGALRDARLAIIADEAEILYPMTGPSLKNSIALLRGLRAVAQETRRLSILLAGVNASPAEVTRVGEDDNPLFGLLLAEYLGPLDPRECQEMIRVVGRKMGLRWEAPAMELIVREVGGHPLLARLAASDVAEAHPERPCRLSENAVRPLLRDFHLRHSSVLREMVDSLSRHYPDELDLLKMIASGDNETASEWRQMYPESLTHLEGYGVVDVHWMSIRIPVLERWFALHASS